MLPFYIYYSMFGFQRVGDAIWAAADQQPRGFLLGATSGRTTLGGEGLQHQDGSSHLVAATIPNCKAYDPAFACELAVILAQGMQDMMVEQRDVFYYITLMNENYVQPDLSGDVASQIIRGCYVFERFGPWTNTANTAIREATLMGSGAILTEVIEAARILAAQGVRSTVLSVTSWSELARDGLACQSASQDGCDRESFLATQLASTRGPIVAASDYVRAVPESLRAFIPCGRHYRTLGTDGFGRSDTRARLRAHFGVNAEHIARTALACL
jgi:pyruvate dehydrogenase E1 component